MLKWLFVVAVGLAAWFTASPAVAASPLEITYVEPDSGPTAGGTVVKVHGQGFLLSTKVTFGGREALDVSSPDESTLIATTPPHTISGGGAHTVDVTVTNPRTGESRTLTDGFRYDDRIPTAVSFQMSPRTVQFGRPVEFKARIISGTSGSSPPPTGLVRFTTWIAPDGYKEVAAVPLKPNGEAIAMVPDLRVGAYDLDAWYEGDGNYAPNGGSSSLVITRARTQLTLTASPASAAYGETVTFSVTVRREDGALVPRGKVVVGRIFQGHIDELVVPTEVDQTGKAVFTTQVAAPLTGGINLIRAWYDGDGETVDGAYEQINLTIGKMATRTVLESSKNPSERLDTVTLTATVTPERIAGTLDGRVHFFEDEVLIASVPLVDGVASLSRIALTIGPRSYVAVYGGSDVYVESYSEAVSQQVTSRPSDYPAPPPPNDGHPDDHGVSSDGGASDGGCNAAGSHAGGPGFWLAGLGIALLVVRRRRANQRELRTSSKTSHPARLMSAGRIVSAISR